MKLVRFVHGSMLHIVKADPLRSCCVYRGFPFIYTFGAVSSAILESPVYCALGEFPRTIYAVEYTVPEGSLYNLNRSPDYVYGDYIRGNYYLGDWVEGFLKGNAALVAAFPSKHWVRQQNYILNPKHDLFSEVKISSVRSIYR